MEAIARSQADLNATAIPHGIVMFTEEEIKETRRMPEEKPETAKFILVWNEEIRFIEWMKLNSRSEEYPKPIVVAAPERKAITPFGMLWWNVMWLPRNVIHAQAVSIAFSKENKELPKRLHKEA